MISLLRSFAGPLMSLAFVMMASGLYNTFVPIRLEIAGFDTTEIGIVTSALYLGIFLGSIWNDRFISKWGHVRSFALFAAALAGLSLMQSIWIDPWYWGILRLMGGVCMAGIFIVIESWLLMQSPSNLRGVILSAYLAVLYTALSLGQLILAISDPKSLYPFCIVAALLTLAIFPISVRKKSEPSIKESKGSLKIVQMYRISPLGFIGGIISGMLLAVVYGLGPVYATEIGMNVSEIGTFMAILIFGGFSLQFPLGLLADKTNRRLILTVISFITAMLAFSIAYFAPGNFYVLNLLAALFGGFSFTLYPISMAYVCERVKEHQIVSATGGFVLSYGIGSIVGPLLAPFAMNFFGSDGFFYFLGFITFLLGLVGLKQPSSAIVDE